MVEPRSRIEHAVQGRTDHDREAPPERTTHLETSLRDVRYGDVILFPEEKDPTPWFVEGLHGRDLGWCVLLRPAQDSNGPVHYRYADDGGKRVQHLRADQLDQYGVLPEFKRIWVYTGAARQRSDTVK